MYLKFIGWTHQVGKLADLYLYFFSDLRLLDYKVRILTPQDGTNALVRVRIESSNKNEKWSTIGVSHNVIDASYIALHDSITYHLLKFK